MWRLLLLFSLLLFSLLLALAPVALARDGFFLQDGQRVLFLGDSITNAGMYVQYLDAYLFTRFPERHCELVNLGLPSETVTGLSEPDHPFPRPDVHERLERALAKVKPDVVVACYGMNDGIYYPFGDQRFEKYRADILRLVERARQAGARVVLMTPPPFDAEAVRSHVLPLGAPKYSWMTPYAGYDEVLARYAAWLITLRGKELTVVDAHGAVARHLNAVRASDPAYRLAGDGVHMNATGHWLIAQELLRTWGAPAEVAAAKIDFRRLKAVRGDPSLSSGAALNSLKGGTLTGVARDGAGVRFTWTTRLPLPADPEWDRRLATTERIAERLNRFRIVATGLPRERYALSEGDRRLGEATSEQLAAGMDLLQYPELSTNRRATELLKLVQQRQRLLAPAWLSDVGHKRPGVAPGLPLEEAKRQAALLEARIRELARPAPFTLRLEPR